MSKLLITRKQQFQQYVQGSTYCRYGKQSHDDSFDQHIIKTILSPRCCGNHAPVSSTIWQYLSFVIIKCPYKSNTAVLCTGWFCFPSSFSITNNHVFWRQGKQIHFTLIKFLLGSMHLNLSHHIPVVTVLGVKQNSMAVTKDSKQRQKHFQLNRVVNLSALFNQSPISKIMCVYACLHQRRLMREGRVIIMNGVE